MNSQSQKKKKKKKKKRKTKVSIYNVQTSLFCQMVLFIIIILVMLSCWPKHKKWEKKDRIDKNKTRILRIHCDLNSTTFSCSAWSQSRIHEAWYHMGRAMPKRAFLHMRAAKAQTSLHVLLAGWSKTSLFANGIIGHYRMFQWKANPDDVNPHILHMFEGLFCFYQAHICCLDMALKINS